MTLSIVLWIVGIHVVEIISVLVFILIRKNQKMENIIISQQEQMDTIGVLINNMDESFKKIDTRVWVGEDEDIKSTFNDMKEIQAILSSILK